MSQPRRPARPNHDRPITLDYDRALDSLRLAVFEWWQYEGYQLLPEMADLPARRAYPIAASLSHLFMELAAADPAILRGARSLKRVYRSFDLPPASPISPTETDDYSLCDDDLPPF